MTKFQYVAKDSEGKRVNETVEAADRYAVYDIARERAHAILSISDIRTFSLSNIIDLQRINERFSRVKEDELIMLTRNLAAMLRAGLAISRALSVSIKQTKNPKLKATLQRIQVRINEGKQFHEALAEETALFSSLYRAMIRSSEETGGLPDALVILAEQMERASSLKKKIKSAMIYPAIVISVLIIIGALMMIYVVPTLTATFVELNVELPVTTKVIVGVSNFLTQNLLLAIVLFALAITGFVFALRTRGGKRAFDFLIIRLPIIGMLTKEINSARTARTLSSLFAAGVDVVRALSITSDVVQNSFYSEMLREVAKRVEKGDPLSKMFIERDHLYPPLVGEMMAVGEETGKNADLLVEVAIFYENEVERKTKDLSTIIEPILMVVIGAAVGFFALAMITPIYSISDSIG